MTKYLWSLALCMLSFDLISQHTFMAKVVDEHTQETLLGATAYIDGLKIGSDTDIEGQVSLTGIPDGTYEVEFSYIGYETVHLDVTFPTDGSVVLIEMHGTHAELEEVVVSTTRSTRSIADIATRVEFINEEELQEKAIMNAANISLVLRESTGIMIQQTSLNSGAASIRIQGLDGRHTQLLKDGFPLYGGLSSGLSIMQIPPLDLSQFEIIKGSNSTLYGGGAIAGLVNMVSKTPDSDEKPELKLMLTGTQAGALTANIFSSQRKGKIGYTLYGAINSQQPYDPDGDDFTNLADTKTYSLNPKLFYYPSDKTTMWFGLNGTLDERAGGDVTAIENTPSGVHQFLETSKSGRVNSQLVLDHTLNKNQTIQFKNSISYFDLDQRSGSADFNADQWDSFTELTLSNNRNNASIIYGGNYYTSRLDVFEEGASVNEQSTNTFGVFINGTFDLSEKVILEGGLRVDAVNKDWGQFVLPRVSLLYKPTNTFSTRIGGGLGYKVPDRFIEGAERYNYQLSQILDGRYLKAERALGVNWDINIKGAIGDQVAVSWNQLFYATTINDALLLFTSLLDDGFVFENAKGAVTSLGSETNVKFTYGDFRLFLQYAYIDSKLNYLPDNPQKPLTPKHNAGGVLMYENDKWRIGFETYYTGKQVLSNQTKTDPYVLMGFMLQKHFKWGSPYINFENFTDRRQGRFSPEVVPPHETPVFQELYAPTDGFIFSVGVMIHPFGRDAHAH